MLLGHYNYNILQDSFLFRTRKLTSRRNPEPGKINGTNILET